MKLQKYIVCPEHGKIIVRVETSLSVEYFSRETAKCPRCPNTSKRLLVHSERSNEID